MFDIGLFEVTRSVGDLKAAFAAAVNQVSARMEGGEVYAGKMFIDATYEGDLFALAGVSFHVGREANSVYGETLNGVQVKNAKSHQLVAGVDPYVKKGDKTSGLLPGVHANWKQPEYQKLVAQSVLWTTQLPQQPLEFPAKLTDADFQLPDAPAKK